MAKKTSKVAANAATETEITAAPTATTETEAASAPAKKAAKKVAAAKKAAKVKKEKTATVAVVRTDTKKAKAIAIVTAGIAAGAARKDTLAKLTSELGMSLPGANTYFQNVKTAKPGWTA